MRWVVLKVTGPGGIRAYGPVDGSRAADAIERLAEGRTRYLATARGRYHAVPLDVWQDGTFDYTKARGVEEVTFA